MVQPVVIEALSGTVGAMTALTLTYPLMAVNTRQQTTQRQAGAAKSQGSGWNTALEMIKEDGSRALFRGWGAAMFGTGVSQLVYFYVYALIRDRLVQTRLQGRALKSGEKGNIGAIQALGVASIAGMINVVATSPVWVVTARLQAMRKDSGGVQGDGDGAKQAEEGRKTKAPTGKMLSVVREVYSDSGLMGFWRGTLPSLLMVSNPAIQYMLFEWLRTQRSRLTQYRSTLPSPGQVFVMGALAKMGATVVTYPMLLIKSRLQAESKHTTYKYNGTWDAIRHIAQTEGVSAFYEGMRTKIVQSVLGAALMFMLKEEIDKIVTRLLRPKSLK